MCEGRINRCLETFTFSCIQNAAIGTPRRFSVAFSDAYRREPNWYNCRCNTRVSQYICISNVYISTLVLHYVYNISWDMSKIFMLYWSIDKLYSTKMIDGVSSLDNKNWQNNRLFECQINDVLGIFRIPF